MGSHVKFKVVRHVGAALINEIEYQSRLCTLGDMSADVPPTEDNASPDPPGSAPPADALPVVDAAKVLGEAREVLLDFHGVRYRLRVTRRGRLILQK
jgi:hemin uptake protein HemP